MCIGSGSLRALDEVLRGVSWEECNQIATVLGLPKTTPSPTSLRDESFHWQSDEVDDGHAFRLCLAKGDVAAARSRLAHLGLKVVAEPVGGRGECLGPKPQGADPSEILRF